MRGLGIFCVLAGCMLVVPARAAEPKPGGAGAAAQPGPGRPRVLLDRLDFPDDTPNAMLYKKELRHVLARVARRMDWGAGRGSTISYRFTVKELAVTVEDGVLRVRFTAVGALPHGRTAKSSLCFGGDPRRRSATVARVLEIVARGVLTRLAELERVRRGELAPSRVRRPVNVD
jgi:hypothetical protein